MQWDQIFASRANRMKASEIRELLKLLDQPDIISFAGGIPDPALFPTAEFEAAFARIFREGTAGAALQYSVSEGYLPLRQWIAAEMGKLGVPCDADNILITSGSQQALDYLGKLLLSPNDTALVGWPTYMGALGAFNAYEPTYDRLPSETNRSAPQYAEAAEAAGDRVKFAYMSVDFANPTGRTMSRAERERMIDLADEMDIAIIEDAAYQMLRFDGEVIPPVLALEIARKGSIEDARTIYCGSFSKTLAPGLRVGWVCAAKPVIRQLVLMKQAADLHSASLNQIVIHEVATRIFDNHVEKLRKVYGARRDSMLQALEDHMPEGVTWTRPEGGMFIWLTLPEGMDGAELLAEALKTQKVAFVPGRAFYADVSVGNTLRLSFSLCDDAAIEEGLSRLGVALREAIARLAPVAA